MQIKYTFRHMESSEAIADYATSQIDRLEKYEVTPMNIHFLFSVQKGSHKVEVHLSGSEFHVEAHAATTDMYSALDEVVDRMQTQLSKHKHRIQHHKKHHFSAEGKLERLQPDLHYEHSLVYRKAARRKKVA